MTPQVSPELRKIQQQEGEVLGLKNVLQSVNRALSGVEDLTVNIVPSPRWGNNPAPAWTDGKKISMDREQVLAVFAEQDLATAILTFKGTNFHELAHVLFTPRSDDAIGTWIKANKYKYKWAWNALEDQRIETLYTALYPPTVPYFRNSSYRWLLNETVGTENFYRVYSLIGGRKYLERSVRRTARQAFVNHYGPEIADRLDEVVNEYVALPLPGHQARAIELVEEFYNLLKGTGLDDYLNQGEGCGGQGASESGEVDPEKAIDASVRVREQLEDEAEQDEADGPQERQEQEPQQGPSAGGYPEDDEDEDEASDSSPAPSSGGYPEDDQEDENSDDGWGDDEPWEDEDDLDGDEDGEDGPEGESEGAGANQAEGTQGEDKAEGDTSDKGAQDDGDSSEGGETQSDGKAGDSASKGTRDQKKTDPAKELQEAINEALADTLTDEDLQATIDRTVESFKSAAAGKGGAEEQPTYEDFSEVDATDEAIGTVQKIVAQLRLLKTDAEATWIRERQNGTRVNINHVIKNQADPTHLEIFEQWDEGYEEEAKTEVVIAIDLSGSMDDILPAASQALWALKKAFDKADVPTTVLGFSDGNAVLYNKDEKLRGLKVRQFNYWSGTEPRDTLLYAHRLLGRSQATNKVLIAITDGKWYGKENDGADPENVVADLRRRGASTLLFGVNGLTISEGRHSYNFEQTANIEEIGDIVKVIKDLVVNIQKNAANR